MADKRKRKQQDRADEHFWDHLDSLGIKGIKAYQQWCSENGFSRRLVKPQFQRRRERVAVRIRGSAREIRSNRRCTLPPGDLTERIVSGRINSADVFGKPAKRLCAAVARIRLLNPQHQRESLDCFRKLLDVSELQKAKFLGGSHPESNENQLRSCSYVEALASIAAFSHRWVRPLDTWNSKPRNQRRQFLSLISHLFEVHPVPAFLFSTWFNPDFESGLKEQSSFIHVAAGHSVRKTNIPIPYSRKMSHHFLHAPSDCNFLEAIRWGQVLGLGGDAALARAVISTQMGEQFENEAFWQTVLKWFIAHPSFDRDKFAVVYDFVRQRKFSPQKDLTRIEIVPGQAARTVVEQLHQPGFSMKGRTPAALIREVRRWHRQLRERSTVSRFSWTHSGIRELRLVEEGSDAVWTIQELQNSESLFREGSEMKHCVWNYSSACQMRRTSIWTMRRTQKRVSKRVLTIEVRLKSRVIAQARGKSNRLPQPEEKMILHKWAEAAKLTVGRI